MSTPANGNRPASGPMRPPIAKRIPTVGEVHGDRRTDEYAWLRDKANPEVRAHLEAENDYTVGILEPLDPLRGTLYDEMLGRLKQTDASVPCREGDWCYYARTEKGRQYPLHCRRPNSPEAPEQITLDLNEMARDEAFMALDAYEVSDDGRLLAYSTDTTGFRQYTLFVKDLVSGEIRETVAERVGSAAWAADNKTLFYTVEDESTKRQHRLYRHVVGEAAHEDDLIYEEPDQAFNVGIDRTRDREYLLLDIDSLTTSEARFLRADRPTDTWRLLTPRLPDQKFEVDHRSDEFYLRVNDRGRQLPPRSHPGREPGAGQLDGGPASPERRDARGLRSLPEPLRRVRARDWASPRADHGSQNGRLAPHRVPRARVLGRPRRERGVRHDGVSLRVRGRWSHHPRSSPTTWKPAPRSGSSRRRFSAGTTRLSTRRNASGRRPKTASGCRSPWSAAVTWARDGQAPVYLYAYGSYGIPLPTRFSSNRLSLLDRGVVVALAHIRGGGDLGKRWHDAGRMLKKRNTFTDFVACAEHLLTERYGSRERLVIEGASAGGLLMGAVTNLRPDLFRAVLMDVPFVDVINTMLDETPATHRGRVRGVGQPQGEVRVRVHAQLLPIHEPEARRVPGDSGTHLAQRLAGDVLGAGQVRGEAAYAQDRRTATSPGDQHGRGPRRRLRPLRSPPGDRLRLRLHPLADGAI